MQINLKQAEIIQALKQYIMSQGINLDNKEVTIAFTAGRKNAGISAELTIEDADIPGFTDTDEEETAVAVTLTPALSIVPSTPEKKVEAPIFDAVEEECAEPEMVPETQPVEEDPVKPKTVSLFN